MATEEEKRWYIQTEGVQYVPEKRHQISAANSFIHKLRTLESVENVTRKIYCNFLYAPSFRNSS